MYECHITINPVFDEQLERVKLMAESHGFKVATLLLKKREDANEQRSQNDTFMTGHDDDFDNLRKRMSQLIVTLNYHNFKVWRYKIEHILLDSEYQNDPLGLLTSQ